VQISTGMITADFREYLQIGVYNASNEEVTLPAGTFMCEVFVHNYPVRLWDEYECDFVDHGGDLDPHNLYIDRLEKYVDYDKEAFELLKAKMDKYPREMPKIIEVKNYSARFLSSLDEIAPSSVNIEFLNIKILSDSDERIEQINKLIEFEDKITNFSSLKMASMMLLVHNMEINIVNGQETPLTDPDNFRDE
jgi:hypothetical protein